MTQLTAQFGRRPDLPTYLGGWLACLSWLMVVGSTVGDAPFNALIFVLTTVGFAVSFWLRGFVDSPHWPAVQRAVMTPSIVIRTLFLFGGVVPGLFGVRPLNVLVPDMAIGNEEWLIGTGFMWAMALYSFGLLSDGLVAFASVLGLSMLGLMGSVNVNPDVGVAFLTFLLGNILMLSNMTLAHHSARRRSGQTAEALARWLVDQLIVAGLTVSLTAFLGIGLAAVLQRISPRGLQPQLQFMRGLISGPIGGSGFQQLSEQMTIGVGGPNLDAPVFAAHVDRPQLWRRRIYDNLQGRVWTPSPATGGMAKMDTARPVIHVSSNLSKLRSIRSTRRVEARLKFATDGALAAPALVTEVELIRAGATGVGGAEVDRDGNLLLNTRKDDELRLVSQVPDASPDLLRQAPAVDRAAWPHPLRIPLSCRDTIVSTARAITRGTTNPYDAAAAIQAWLETDFVYDLAAIPPPGNADVMAWYFRTKRGACDLAATAMVLLARASGIPARVAVGYGAGKLLADGTYDIRTTDTHAWAELYFPGYEWVPFNPAVPEPAQNAVDAAGGDSSRGHHFRGSVRAWLVLLAALWLLQYSLRNYLRGLPRFAPNPAGEIERAYDTALRLLARRKLARRPGETPAGYLRRLRAGPLPEPWLTALADLTGLYERVRYELGPVDADDYAQAAAQLTTLKQRARAATPAPAPSPRGPEGDDGIRSPLPPGEG